MRTFTLFIFLCITQFAFAQYKVPPINGWRVHLPYHTNPTLAQHKNIIYAGSSSGVYSYDAEAEEMESFDKANGLSDVEVVKLEFDSRTSTLIIAYKNANIDLLSNGRIFNISSILKQSIMGDKSINDILVHEGFAYLACSFGIVKIDLSKKQIVDSYQNIGAGGDNLNVKDLAIYNQLYASSNQGLFSASLTSGNLSDFNFWTSVFNDSTNQLLTFNNKLYLSSGYRLMAYDGNSFNEVVTDMSKEIKNMRISNGKMLVIQNNGIKTFDTDMSMNVLHENAVLDAVLNSSGQFFISIDQQGLVHIGPMGNKYISPGGPFANTAVKFTYSHKQNLLFVAGGSVQGLGTAMGWRNSYNKSGYYIFDGTEWKNGINLNNPLVDRCIDLTDVVTDEKTDKTYFTSFETGVLELTKTTPTQVYDTANTKGALGYFVNEFETYRPVFASGATIDNTGNLWVSCYGAAKPLSVKTPAGQWHSFTMNGNNSLNYMVCDNNRPRNNKWIMSTRTGNLIVYNEGADISSTQDDLYAELTTEKGKGNLPSRFVLSMALDKNDEMWIGTDAGLCIISDPTAVFSNTGRSYDARQLVINTGSFNSIILGTEPILCIKVDGANRKWIGTRNGAWLLSEDGYTIIHNFTTENSPLLSNTVYDIGIFEATGEVFFATDKGIISFAGNATTADDKHGKVLVYPNPVKPSYTGDITIRGLVENANVKITDIAGNLVYETKANGGMATWNGITFSGNRAATGVYLIYSTGNEDINGERDTYVTKLLFVN
jgi:hypothetical protein